MRQSKIAVLAVLQYARGRSSECWRKPAVGETSASHVSRFNFTSSHSPILSFIKIVSARKSLRRCIATLMPKQKRKEHGLELDKDRIVVCGFAIDV